MDAEWDKGLYDLELPRAINWLSNGILTRMGNVGGVG